MGVEKIAVVDMETYAIKARPDYPPKPVGMAFRLGSEKHQKGYLACRSPSERAHCKTLLKGWAREGYRFMMHHAGFDLDVIETHLGVSWPSDHDDTLILAYLLDPRAPTFSLKPMAERVLGEPPTERDALKEWIVENVAGATAKNWGAFISEAPFELVRPYAIGDVDRTWRLYRYFLKELGGHRTGQNGINMTDNGKMWAAYHREKKVTRVLVKMERHGVPVATELLRKDLGLWRAKKQSLEAKLYTDLKVRKKDREEFSWSGVNFAKQVVESGLVDELPKTAKGNPSTAADTLGPLIPPKVAARLELRAQLQTCIVTFGEAWLAQAEHGGRFYARYNQVRQDYHGGGKMVGTTTGRLSMSPNLQNVIRSDKGDEVPQLRKYLVPFRGGWWLKRDVSQQELRIFAHFSEGELLERYKADPTIDAHTTCGLIISDRTGLKLDRRPIKDINFGVLYGMGRAKMAIKLKMPLPTAIKVLAAYHRALPEVRALQKELKALAAKGHPYYTIGGRRYYCEPPKMMEVVKDGTVRREERSFEYKMLNGLVQGSAADHTKQAMVLYDESGWNEPDMAPLVLQVHDELNALAKAKQARAAMRALDEAMLAAAEIDVPMLSDGSASRVSWDACEKVNW